MAFTKANPYKYPAPAENVRTNQRKADVSEGFGTATKFSYYSTDNSFGDIVVSDHSAGFGGTKDATRSLMNSSQINRKDETVTTPNTDTEQGAYPQQASFGVESTVQYIYSASPKLHKVSLY